MNDNTLIHLPERKQQEITIKNRISAYIGIHEKEAIRLRQQKGNVEHHFLCVEQIFVQFLAIGIARIDQSLGEQNVAFVD